MKKPGTSEQCKDYDNLHIFFITNSSGVRGNYLLELWHMNLLELASRVYSLGARRIYSRRAKHATSTIRSKAGERIELNFTKLTLLILDITQSVLNYSPYRHPVTTMRYWSYWLFSAWLIQQETAIPGDNLRRLVGSGW